ncbi:MAG: hypothetical protein LBL55_08425, partial [Propionibacteriaceae bacterium]|nr:hypothetical protein [Propionibacteriaceae bacterium]
EPFFVLFHELGHGNDDVEEPFGVETNDYTYNGKTIKDALADDVRNNLMATISDPALAYTSDPEQQRRVVDAIMAHSTASLSQADREVLTKLQERYAKVFSKPSANVVSDIYGAVTDNIIKGDTVIRIITGRITRMPARRSSGRDTRPIK